MAACGEPAFVQIALTPTPASFERLRQALYTGTTRRASRASAASTRVDARPLDGRGRRAARRSRDPAPAAVLRRPARRRPESQRTASRSRSRCERAAGREPARRARQPVRQGVLGAVLAGACSAARATRSRPASQGVFASTRAGGAVAAAHRSITRRVPLRARRRCRSRRRRRDLPPGRRSGHAARRLRAGVDPPRDAPPEHGGARHGRAGQVELPRRDRRRGPAARALRGDRARPEGRRGRGGPQHRSRRSAPARCWTSPTRPAASTRSRSTRRPT